MDKFKSRKFIISVITMLLGIVTALTEIGGTVGTVCGIIAAILAPIIYVIVEGVVDAKAVSLTVNAIEVTKTGVEELKDGEKNGG